MTTSSPQSRSDRDAIDVGAGGASLKAAYDNAAPAIAILGTARRSAYPTARGPAATIAVEAMPSAADQIINEPGPPSTSAHADAAIWLLIAIHAKLVMNSTPETICAPRWPSGARAAIMDGTPNRDPTGASSATSNDPKAAPIRVMRIAVCPP